MFDKCQKMGGRIRTKSLSGDRYMHVCYKDGKSYPGYVKSKNKKREAMRNMIKK